MDAKISKENAQQVAVEFLKKRKNTLKIDVATIEQHNENWIIRGTCPIDMEGHPWAERFEIIVDLKGKVRSLDLALL